MRFYCKPHAHYCGMDLHARTMYLCILNADGEVVLHKNMPSSPEAFLRAVRPYREKIVVSAECIFTWYWLADALLERGHDVRILCKSGAPDWHTPRVSVIASGFTPNAIPPSDPRRGTRLENT